MKTKLIDADFAALLRKLIGCTSAWEQGAPFTWTEPLAKRLKTDTLASRIRNSDWSCCEKWSTRTFKATRDVNLIRFYSSHYTLYGQDDGRCRQLLVCTDSIQRRAAIIGGKRANGFKYTLAIQVAPMDRYGNLILVFTSITDLLRLSNSKIVIVEVNEKMPIALGYESHINISDVNYIIEEKKPRTRWVQGGTGSEDRSCRVIIDRVKNEKVRCSSVLLEPPCQMQSSLLAESDVRDLIGHSEVIVIHYESPIMLVAHQQEEGW